MRLKSYFASTVEAAMTLASRELGEDALLVYSREAPGETSYLGRYEVVIASGVPPVANDPAPAPSAAAATVPAGPPRALDPAPAELTPASAGPEPAGARFWHNIEQRLDRIEQRLASGTAAAAEPSREHVWSGGLAAQGIPLALAREVAAKVPPDAGPASGQAIAAVLEDCLLPPAFDELSEAGATVVLAGPSGAGKTTVAVKLAQRLVGQHRQASLICWDHYRICGEEQLRRYARLLGIPYRQQAAAESGLGLSDSGETIVIDTPGWDTHDDEIAEQLTGMLTHIPKPKVFLVLAASMATADLIRVAQRFKPLSPSGLIFTRLDEAGAAGAMWTVASLLGLPIEYTSSGQQVPEDIDRGSPVRLASGIARAACSVEPTTRE